MGEIYHCSFYDLVRAMWDHHDHVDCCVPEEGSVRVLPCSAGSCIPGPVWSSRQEMYPEDLRAQIYRDGTKDEEFQQFSHGSQCSKLKKEYDSMEIDWHWG